MSATGTPAPQEPTMTFTQALKAHGITAERSADIKGLHHLIANGEHIGNVHRLAGDRTWTATALTSQGAVDRGDWYDTKTEAIMELLAYAKVRTENHEPATRAIDAAVYGES